MKTIPLTQGKVAIVDDEDFELVSKHKWQALKPNTSTYYAVTMQRNTNGKRELIYMHRLILNPQSGELVDHRDGNGLNNSRSNIRICTSQQNNSNRISIGGESKYKGVVSHFGKWVARIRINGNSKQLGRFKTETDAARAYDKAAKELNGEFARLNFPNE